MKQNPELEVLETLANTILVAARTAPKGKGIDDIVTYLFNDDDRMELADKMDELSETKGLKFLIRDAQNVRDADCLLIIGLKSSGVSSLNCGACGYETCADMVMHKKVKVEFTGPHCMIKYMDLGIAVGSAASKAKDLCIDNRILYSAGAAACYSGMVDADVAMGIPLSIKGKNIFFDRKTSR